jgi:hypothetical protein
MLHLTRICSIVVLFMLCLFAVSCDDSETDACPKYFLLDFTNDVYAHKLFYNDDALIDAVIQTVPGHPEIRYDYAYNASGQLIRFELRDVLYSLYTYDDAGRIELIQSFDAGSEDFYQEVKYFYGDDGKLHKHEIYAGGKLAEYHLYSYPSDNVLEVQTFTINYKGEIAESLLVYTLDNNPTGYPAEYYLGSATFGGIILSNNVVSYKVFKDGVEDTSASQSGTYEYNDKGYPTSVTFTGVITGTFTYSCDPVKEQ